MTDVPTFDEVIAALTIYGEARGEPEPGKVAIGHVIRNSIKRGRWGKTVAAVCLFPARFSCWLSSDPNRRKLLEVPHFDESFQKCLAAWRKSETEPDRTEGSDHYQVVGTDAYWSRGRAPTVTIGHHQFYAGIQ